MSVFLFLEKETEQKARIMCVHNFPDMLTEEEKKNGVLVDSYNEPTPQPGETALPYWNYETQEIFFEYVDSSQPEQEREIKELKTKILELNETIETQAQAIAELSMLFATK